MQCLAWHSDSIHLASGGSDTHIFLWNVTKKRKKAKIPLYKNGPVSALAWKNDTDIVSAGHDCAIRVHKEAAAMMP